jgi:RNA polymerase sigma factor for flagellar operon FliA
MKLSTEYGDRIDLVAATRDESREAMILSYLPLVRMVAERVRRRLPPGVDVESLVHSGVVGLLEALERYDPERGVSFQTYARHRIHGEIIQCLRSLDWVSRSVRSWSRKIATARKKLAMTLCREASSEEVAEELGLSLDSYHRVHCKVNEFRPVTFDDPDAALEDEHVKQRDEYDHTSYEDPVRSVERKDLMEKLREAIGVLPERERRVVELHHREELTLREIGRRMELTEGRICQIYNKACKTLRGALLFGGDYAEK